MKLLRKVGSASNIFQIFVADSSSTTGAGLTGLTNASGSLTAYYHRDTDTTATAIALVTMTVGTFTSSGFKEIDSTNMPGWYQFCPPDAALASGAKSVAFHLKGATNMAPLPIEVDLDAQVDLTHILGTAVSTPAAAGVLDVNAKNINNVATTSVTTVSANVGTTQPVNYTGTGAAALVKSDTVDIAGAAVSATTAQLGVNVVNWNNAVVATPATAGIPDVNVKNAGNVAWASGALTSAVFAAGAINAAAIADAAIDTATFAADTGLQTIRSNTAQAGASTTITLDASASATDNFYRGALVYLTGGTGAGQYRLVTGYVGSTKVATVAPAWTTNPGATSTFAVLPEGMTDLESAGFTAVTLDANNVLNVSAKYLAGTALTGRDVGASVLLSSGAGAGQLDFTSGVVKANVTQLLGTAWLAPGTAGTPDVNVKLWNGLTTVSLPLVPTVAGRTLDVSAGGEAGVDWANVGSPTTAVDLSNTTIKITQKVDVDTIKTNPVVNGGTVTFPTGATLASTTNITAGTITTTTNVTNRVTANTDQWAGGTIPAPNTTGVPLVDTKYVGGTLQTAGDVIAAVSNIAVTGAALNAVAAGATYTTGTDSGGYTNTFTADGVYDAVAQVGGAVDFYYQFSLGSTGQTAVGVDWLGYVVGAVNTVKVYAYNWGAAGWDQVGNVVGISGAVNQSVTFDLTNSHTGTGGNLGLVRLRFAATGLVGATVNTDRILCGYTVVTVFPTNFSALGITAGGAVSEVVLTDTLTTYTNNTPQTGDAYAVVNSATFGNAKLVRSTTPANTLDVSATGEAGLDFNNVKDATAPHTLTNIRVPNVTLVDTITTYTGDTPQTGDSFARIGVAGVGLTNLGDARIAHLDADVSSRMATYTQPTGFLAATFPAGTIVNNTVTPTWYTAPGSVPTAAENATAVWTDLLAGSDFSTVASIGKLLKDDIDAAVSSRMATYAQPAGFLATTFAGTVGTSTYAGGAVASVTGNVGGNVAGSVGSISGVTFPTNFGSLGITAAGKISEVVLTDTAAVVTTNNDKTGYALTAAYDAAKTAAQVGSAMTLGAGAITDTAFATSGANRVADTTRRRSQANVEASAYGDAISLPSDYGFVQQAQESDTTTTPGLLTVYQTDGATVLGTRTITTDAAAQPITGAH